MSRAVVPPAERLQMGKDSYDTGDLATAYYHFKLAARSCPDCAPGKADKLCLCKDLLKAIKENSLKYELKKPCRCDALSNQRCSRAEHMMALNYVVAVELKRKRLKSCLQYCQKMISISPRDPTGYLRLGKTLRLDNQAEAAMALYNQGIDMVQRKQPDHEQLSALRDQAKAVAKFLWRGDPLKDVPQELALMVFRYFAFDTRQLGRCLRVSKKWNQFLTSNTARPLWVDQRYSYLVQQKSNYPRPVSLHNINTFMWKLAQGQVTSLAIDDCQAFGLSHQKMAAILRQCPRLEHLTLQETMRNFTRQPGNCRIPKLKSLYLGHGVEIEPAFLMEYLQASSDTMIELSVFDLPQLGFSPSLGHENWPALPKLEILRLAGKSMGVSIDLDLMIRGSPNVHTLWIDKGLPVRIHGRPKRTSDWPKLRKVFIGKSFIWTSDALALPDQLAELCIESGHTHNFDRLRDVAPDLSKLRKFSYREGPVMKLDELAQHLGPSLRSGSLEELIVRPLDCPDLSNRSDADLKWLRNKSVRVLSVTGMTLFGQDETNREKTFFRLLDLFEGLHTLEIENGVITPTMVAKIILKTGVRTLYHQQGFALNEVRDYFAQEDKSVKIMHAAYPDAPFSHERRR